VGYDPWEERDPSAARVKANTSFPPIAFVRVYTAPVALSGAAAAGLVNPAANGNKNTAINKKRAPMLLNNFKLFILKSP
jgi:hypothetical protein